MLDKFRRPLGAPGLIQYKDVALTNAELEALFTVPKTLVAAPPTGYHLIFEGAHLYKPTNTDVQTVGGTSEFAVHLNNIAGLEVGQCETTGFMDQATAQFRHMNPFRAASGVSSITPVTASPLILCVLVADLSDGDAVLKVRTFYRVIPDAILA